MFSVMTGSSSFNSLSCVEVQRVVQWSAGPGVYRGRWGTQKVITAYGVGEGLRKASRVMSELKNQSRGT